MANPNLYSFVDKRKAALNLFTNNGLLLIGMMSKKADEQNAQLKKADTRANKRNKYTPAPNNTAILQDLLWKIGAFKGVKDRKGREATYNTAVDGITGKMTRTAMQNAEKMGYFIKNDGTLGKMSNISGDMIKTAPKKKEEKKEKKTSTTRFMTSSGAMMPAQVMAQASEAIANNKTLLNSADFLGHNPAMIALEDLDRANSNRLAEALFGVRPFKGRTITRLPNLQTEELKKQVLFARQHGKNGFDANMYKLMYGHNYASRNGEDGQDRSGFRNRMNTPKGRLEHTLGAYGFYTDEEGNTIVHDIYDFNVGQKLGGDGRYAVTRNFLGEFGSKSTDPTEGKIRYRINLGKL